MLSLQTTDQIHKVISWNDATVTGIAIAVALACAYGMFYMYKTSKDERAKTEEKIENIHKDYAVQITTLYEKYIEEVKSFNVMIVKINNQYTESLHGLNNSIKSLVDFKKN